MASILDIETTLSDKTTRDIICKQWYWNEFLPKIDEDNIRNDYRLVYQEFSECQWMSLPYNYPECAWQWLLENKIIILSRYDDSDSYGWYDKYEDHPVIRRNVNDCYKYRLTDKFFEDYQKSVRERKMADFAESYEQWLYHLDNTQKHGFDSSWYHSTMKNYAWPIMYNQPI